jgi:hypothetical protein
MNSKQRMITAMSLKEADCAPVMCQLSIGHLLRWMNVKPVDLWFTAQGCAHAWVEAQRRYRFDGILLNLCGPDRDVMQCVDRIEEDEYAQTIYWRPGRFDYTHTICPWDELPRNVWPDGEPFADFDTFDPDTDLPSRLEWLPVCQAMKYPIHPASCFDTLNLVKSMTHGEISLHGEVFSPWDYHLATFGPENALIAVIEDAGKVHAILEGYAELCAKWAVEQIQAGVNAITLSSPWAGGKFISRQQYQEFVQPYERIINNAVRAAGAFCCTHTCGALGDRLDLLMASNTCGIECLDPPPLGDVELKDAKEQTRGKVFIKGNMDSVNVLLKSTPREVKEYARACLETAMDGGGYILSASCAVAPHVPPENLEVLFDVVNEFGKY